MRTVPVRVRIIAECGFEEPWGSESHYQRRLGYSRGPHYDGNIDTLERKVDVRSLSCNLELH